MDPISLIVAALATGASTALKDTAGDAIDTYNGLKSLLKRKFGGEPLAESVLDNHEQAPEVWEKPLEQQLGESGAGDDEAIVQAAQKLLELADPEGRGRASTTSPSREARASSSATTRTSR